MTESNRFEIPTGQRFVGRRSLEKLFSTRSSGKASRDRLVAEANTAHGYSEMEVASFLGLHYSTISRILVIPWTLLPSKFTPLNYCWLNNSLVKIVSVLHLDTQT